MFPHHGHLLESHQCVRGDQQEQGSFRQTGDQHLCCRRQPPIQQGGRRSRPGEIRQQLSEAQPASSSCLSAPLSTNHVDNFLTVDLPFLLHLSAALSWQRNHVMFLGSWQQCKSMLLRRIADPFFLRQSFQQPRWSGAFALVPVGESRYRFPHGEGFYRKVTLKA